MLQPLEGAPLKAEPSLLRDNQQLVDALQRTEAQVKVKHFDLSTLDPDWNMKLIDGFVSVIPCQTLRVKVAQLEEARNKADSRVSNHKQATQLLQTELQDSRAQVDEKEKAIQSLRHKLRESEVGFHMKDSKHTEPSSGVNDNILPPHRKMPHQVLWSWKSCGPASSKCRWS